MSSTYVSAHRVGAFRTSHGFGYVHFLETCESNVFPRTPHWSACKAGTLQQLAFWHAQHLGDVDGGMTKGARGRAMTAETWLTRCQEAMAQAGTLRSTVCLDVHDGFYGIALRFKSHIEDLAKRHLGRELLTLCGSGKDERYEATLDLNDPRTGDLLLDLLALRVTPEPPKDAWESDSISVWRIFQTSHVSALEFHQPDRGAAAVPGPSTQALRETRAAAELFLRDKRIEKFEVPSNEAQYYPAGHQEQRVVDAAGNVLVESAWRILDWFCKGFLADANSKAPGTASAALKAYRLWEKKGGGDHEEEATATAQIDLID